MRTTFVHQSAPKAPRHGVKQLTTAAIAVLLAATPSLAEAPTQLPTLTQQNNIRRLVLTNECMGCDLAGVELTEAHLIGADLRDANLQFANLTGSNLEGADLKGADLTGANLTGAFLTHANLADTQLVGVNFTHAHLYNVDVTGANMENLTLVNAEIHNTPISVGGEEGPLDNGRPTESIIPFEEIHPPVELDDYPLRYPELPTELQPDL